MNFFAFTIDLEPDYAGCVDQYEIFKEKKRIEEILLILNSFDVKITVFVVGKVFELFPKIVELFEKYGCEFESHSYFHNSFNPNSDSEIEMAKKAYFNYFKKFPMGYRAPQGRISKIDIKSLEKHGFLYDSSIFPSYYPNPFRYLFCKKRIHYVRGSNIMEIPFTSITSFRLTLSLSYMKLLGIDVYFELLRFFSLPNVICFGTHLHDFIVNENSYSKLSYFWKFVYGRNKYSGTDYCIKFLKYIKRIGYHFCFMSEIYNKYKDKNIEYEQKK